MKKLLFHFNNTSILLKVYLLAITFFLFFSVIINCTKAETSSETKKQMDIKDVLMQLEGQSFDASSSINNVQNMQNSVNE